MKELLLQRAWSDSRATVGMLTVLGELHDPIFTLENPLRATNVDNRIPEGHYECVPYSGTKFQNVYLVEGVPNRTAILIHWGNFEKDTDGCILVGLGAQMLSGEPAVVYSKKAFDYLKGLVGEEKFMLTIKDRFNG